MTMGMMQGYRQAVQQFSGIKKLTDEAMHDWLDIPAREWPERFGGITKAILADDRDSTVS